MRNSAFRPKWFLVAAAACAALCLGRGAVSPLYAQQDDNPFEMAEPADENPFDAEMPAAEDPFDVGVPADEPVEDDAPRPGRRPARLPDTAPSTSTAPQDPAVLAVLESDPQTPFELLRAIRILADLGHARQAEPYVEQLVAQKLDQAALAALFERFRPDVLMRIARHSELREQIGPFIDALYQAADAVRRDPQRLTEWGKLLSDPDESVRAQAVYALLRAREAAVAPLLATLADPARRAEHPAARRMLLRLNEAAVPALLGALEASDESLQVQVIELLGALRARQAVAPLVSVLLSPDSSLVSKAMAAAALERARGHVPDGPEAARLLARAVTQRLEQSRDAAGDGPPGVVVWRWDTERNESVPVPYNATDAALDEAVRLAYGLYRFDPESAERRRLYLTALLQAAKLRESHAEAVAGPGTPYGIAAEAGPAAVEDVLVHALADGYLPAATAAAEILGDIGSVDLLARGGAAPSPLARAAHHADRRLRFAAIGAIVKLDPAAPFAGSSYVTEGLGFFAGAYGTPRILIAHPLSAEGARLAGLAAALGYEADIATTGRQAYELAVQSPDYEAILIHSAINRPAADELLAQFRRDRRTTLVPVGFIAPLDDLPRWQEFARRAGRAEAFLQPQNDAEMNVFVGDVLARAGRAHVPVAERRTQALAALEWLVELGQRPTSVFEVRQLEPSILPLLYVPEAAGRAVELLADIGTDKSQRALVELAHSAAQPPELRMAAVTALGRNARRHGILLRTDEIRRQYDVYNANAGRDVQTHEVLEALLDVIEYRGDPPRGAEHDAAAVAP